MANHDRDPVIQKIITAGTLEVHGGFVVGIDPEVVAALVRQHGEYSELQQRELARLEGLLTINRRQVRAALEVVGEADIAPEEYGTKLVEIARRLNALSASTRAAPSDNSTIAELKVAAQAAIDAGELASADDLLSQIEAEQERSVLRQSVEYAKTLEQRGDLAFARLRYLDAAGHYSRAAAAIREPCEYSPYFIVPLNKEANALYRQGIEFGDNKTLLLAAERLRALSQRFPRTSLGPVWATAQNALADVLIALGARETGTAQLEEGIAVLEQVLTELPRERSDVGWATAQKSLGHLFLRLDERETGTGRLEQAIGAYQASQEVFTRAHNPRAWARSQNGLGLALARLGERENDVARLEEAIVAFEGALEESPRKQFPLEWALIKSNLSVVLLRLGEREGGPARLDESVAAARAALEERTRMRTPLGWGETQVHLGNALAKLGEHEGGTTRLEEAVSAYRAALTELSFERAPHYWMMIQDNLCNVLSLIGERESASARTTVPTAL